MVLYFPGKTKCVLCANPILGAEDSVGFPAFLPVGHRFHAFSDAAFHRTCFMAWPSHEEFEAVYAKYRRIWDSRPKNLTSLAQIEAWGKEAFKDL